MNSVRQIYPPEPELMKTTESPTNCSYLDLNITISGMKFISDLYDEREAFNFRIVNFLHMASNVPSNQPMVYLFLN